MGLDYNTLTELLLNCEYIDAVTYWWDEENEKREKDLCIRVRAIPNDADYLGYTYPITRDEMPGHTFAEPHARYVAMHIIEVVKDGLGIK